MLRTQEKKNLDLHNQGGSVNPRQIKARIQVHECFERICPEITVYEPDYGTT